MLWNQQKHETFYPPISQENAPIFRSVKLVKFPAMSQLLVKILFLLIALKFIEEIYRRVEVLPPNLGESSPKLQKRRLVHQTCHSSGNLFSLYGRHVVPKTSQATAGLGRNSSRGKWFFHSFSIVYFFLSLENMTLLTKWLLKCPEISELAIHEQKIWRYGSWWFREHGHWTTKQNRKKSGRQNERGKFLPNPNRTRSKSILPDMHLMVTIKAMPQAHWCHRL